MYLSKLSLDPRQSLVQRDLSDAYEMHRTLARAFAPDQEAVPGRFLWRLEAASTLATSATVLVQSAEPADWSSLRAIPGYVLEAQENKAFDLEALFQNGGRYRFRLKANPTVTRAGKRYGLLREEEQLAWLARQGESHGFSVLACMAGNNERIQVPHPKSGNRITVDAVVLDGLLEVTDGSRLRRAIQQGLGHAKALGLGLLSLARVR